MKNITRILLLIFTIALGVGSIYFGNYLNSQNTAPLDSNAATDCQPKWFMDIQDTSTDNGINYGKCILTSGNYNPSPDFTDCTNTAVTCTQNLRTYRQERFWGLALCYDSESECVSPSNMTVSFLYFYNPAIGKCWSTNHRYEDNSDDPSLRTEVDEPARNTCTKNVEIWTNQPNEPCYLSMPACEAAQVSVTPTLIQVTDTPIILDITDTPPTNPTNTIRISAPIANTNRPSNTVKPLPRTAIVNDKVDTLIIGIALIIFGLGMYTYINKRIIE